MKKALAMAYATEDDDIISEAMEAAKKASATTMFSADEAAEALYYMGVTGWDASQSIEALPAVLNLVAAFIPLDWRWLV